jgi:hypothetical protein
VTIESDHPGQTRPIQPKISNQYKSCYEAIIKLQPQANSMVDIARLVADRRIALRGSGRSDLATHKAHTTEVQNNIEILRTSTLQFQTDWMNWKRDCWRPPIYTDIEFRRMIAPHMEAIQSIFSTLLAHVGKFDIIEHSNCAASQNCPPCFTPWEQHCDLGQCILCCTNWPLDEIDWCYIGCKNTSALCIMAGIHTQTNEIWRGIVRNINRNFLFTFREDNCINRVMLMLSQNHSNQYLL